MGMGLFTLSHVEWEEKGDEGMLFRQCRSAVREGVADGEFSTRLAVVLPFAVESTLNFVLQEGLTNRETVHQLQWCLDNPAPLLVIDVVRFILSLPPQLAPLEQTLCVLGWLLERATSQPALFQ